MITFKQHLQEGRDAPLYHGTNEVAGIKMLMNTNIQANTTQYAKKLLRLGAKNAYPGDTGWHVVQGFSTTRDLEYAAVHIEHIGFIFELNQTKLAQRYKIIPVNWYTEPARPKSTESEEFVISNKAVPLDLYLMRFWMYGYRDAEHLRKTYIKQPKRLAQYEKYVLKHPNFAGFKLA